ncbi:M56 family metallopeptidase [Dyella ginsengisoli]|uniref:M56 family metallopeptidase n=1 Tax=Dyella ginsengisoli TaxID=363848 RepID=UPI0003478084|nr:M56 family metallopeptidase [Dyella ginsengisoli]
MHAVETVAAALLERLAWSSLQACVLIGAVALLIRLRPQLPAAVRCLLWWLVGLQLLVGLAWHDPVPLHWLAAVPTQAPAHIVAPPTVVTTQGLPLVTPATAPTLIDTAADAGRSLWHAGLAALWLAGLLSLLTRALRQRHEAWSLRRDSVAIDDAALLALCSRRARQFGLRRAPALRSSARVESPQVVGAWRPTILLPAEHTLSPDETAMALDHELAHLRRGDLWLAWVPALAQRLFFFHPLVRWAMREYALHREAACDAQVLRHSGSAPQAYGRLLLRLGVGHPLHAGLAGASPTFENLKRRLTMLQQTESSARLRGWLLVALIAAVGVVPYRVTAAAPSHATPAASAAPATAIEAAPTPQAAPDARPMPVVAPMPPPPPPVAPPAPPAPPPPPLRNMAFSGYSHVDIDTDDHARNGFALFDGDSVTMSGTDGDIALARHQRKGSEPLLWVRRGDKAYLIRDAATLARAKAIYAPVTAIAREQGELGGKQGELGGRQGGLGAQQGALGRQQAELAMERVALIGQKDADARSADLQAREHDLQARQAELGKRQAELGAQQAALGKQQAELGKRQQAASARADREIAQLIDAALAKGTAQSVPLR